MEANEQKRDVFYLLFPIFPLIGFVIFFLQYGFMWEIFLIDFVVIVAIFLSCIYGYIVSGEDAVLANSS